MLELRQFSGVLIGPIDGERFESLLAREVEGDAFVEEAPRIVVEQTQAAGPKRPPRHGLLSLLSPCSRSGH